MNHRGLSGRFSEARTALSYRLWTLLLFDAGQLSNARAGQRTTSDLQQKHEARFGAEEGQGMQREEILPRAPAGPELFQ
jgi:hypothetical protein